MSIRNDIVNLVCMNPLDRRFALGGNFHRYKKANLNVRVALRVETELEARVWMEVNRVANVILRSLH